MHDQIRGLVGQGHEIEVWCPPTADRKFLPLTALVKEHVVEMKDVPNQDTSWLGRTLRLGRSVNEEVTTTEEHCRRCAEEINEGKFDLLIAHPCRRLYSSPIGGYCKIPSILYLQEPNRSLYEAMPRQVWESLPPLRSRFSRSQWRLHIGDLVATQGRRFQVRTERTWASAYRQILVNSLFSRESVLRAYGLDSRVCYLGIDTETFRPTGAAKEKLVVGLGSLLPHKRPLLAIRAIGAMPEEKRARIIWVGNSADDAYLKSMQEEARTLKVDFTLKVLISDEELRDLLSRAAALIYTSHLEPFGYAPLEANACGTGVVAIAEGGIRETVSDGINGVLISGADPAAFAEALEEFTEDLDYATQFGRKARAHVERLWSSAGAVDRLEHEIRRVVPSPDGETREPAYEGMSQN